MSKFDYTYDAVGNILTWQPQADSTATRWTYGYDAADELIAAATWTTGVTPTILKRYAYGYDATGNRAYEQIDDTVTGASYDVLNRLVSQPPAGGLRVAGTVSEPATVTVAGKPATVTTDNIFSATVPIGAGTNTIPVTATDPSGNSATQAYQVTSSGSTTSFTYDANGNLTADSSRTFEWDAENRLVAVNLGTHRSEFTYDGLSRRTRVVEKESGGTVRDANLLWDGTQIIEERLSTGEVNRFFEDGEQHNGVARYLTRDHLGSIREVTDAAGAVVTRNDYDPYGRLTRVAGTEDSRFGYTGHMNHVPSGLALALYRAYDPVLGRWLSSDPARYVDGPNLYAYARNRPSTLHDPLGLFVPAIPIIIVIDWAIEAGLYMAGVALTTALIHDLTQAYFAKKADDDRNWRQDKKLTDGEIRKLEEAGVDVHDLKGGKKTGQFDLYKDKDGNISIKPKGGSGPGEPTGININNPGQCKL